MKKNVCIMLATTTVTFSSSLFAAVSAEEAKELGSALTWWGAEKSGNKDGTIPAWTGERITPPADYDAKEPGRLPNPWKDKPLFAITAQNMDKYASTLTVGQKALFKKYPNYRMDIYPSHRIMRYPDYVKENTLKNATSCKTENNGLILTGCYGGFPFPIPKTGNEVMWNHLLSYSAYAITYSSTAFTVTNRGNQVIEALNKSHEYFPFFDPKRKTPFKGNEVYWKIRFESSEPARKAGEKYLILDSLDAVNIGSRVWSYLPGQRRVKLAPDLRYDTPNPQSGGVMTMDQPKLFLGAQDRYDFKLIGKQERYIAPNSFEMVDWKVCPNEKWGATKGYINPDCMRWELHRVWAVEMTIKPGYRHILPKRTLYVDEDTFASGISDDYDASGALYRVTVNPGWPFYTNANGGQVFSFATSMDLQVGIYNFSGQVSAPNSGPVEETPPAETYFSPEAMAGEGIR